jgi:hypothetical protein
MGLTESETVAPVFNGTVKFHEQELTSKLVFLRVPFATSGNIGLISESKGRGNPRNQNQGPITGASAPGAHDANRNTKGRP